MDRQQRRLEQDLKKSPFDFEIRKQLAQVLRSQSKWQEANTLFLNKDYVPEQESTRLYSRRPQEIEIVPGVSLTYDTKQGASRYSNITLSDLQCWSTPQTNIAKNTATPERQQRVESPRDLHDICVSEVTNFLDDALFGATMKFEPTRMDSKPKNWTWTTTSQHERWHTTYHALAKYLSNHIHLPRHPNTK